MSTVRDARPAATSGDEYVKGIHVYGEEMISVDDAEEMIEAAFDAGRGGSPAYTGAATGCHFEFRTVGDIQRLAALFEVPEIRPGDVFEFGWAGIERVES